jgi:arylsulfatase A-like enzyme
MDGHFHYPMVVGRDVWENDRELSSGMDLCYTTDLFTARAKKWIADHRAARPEQPFLVYLAYDTPHAKLQNPPCAYPQGGGLKGGVQWLGTPKAMINTATGTVDGYLFPGYANATWDDDADPATPEVPWPDVQKRYANNVRRIDFAVGDLLRLLKDLGIDDNTLVVFSSDNGPSTESYLPENYSPEFFRGYGPFDGIKRDTWEGGIREPTLVRWPARIPAGRVDEQPSGQWDWLATFCDVAGVAKPASSDGVSRMPALTGIGEQEPGTIYIEYFNNAKTPNYDDFDPAHRGRKRGQMQVIQLNGYKGIRYNIQSADDDFEIYNLVKDPRETRDLGRSPEMADLQAAMKARVLQLRSPDAAAERPYDAACVPAGAHAPEGKPAFTRSVYLGEWPWMPDFASLIPADRQTTDGIALPDIPPDQPFGLAFEGWFHAEQDGDYLFTLSSDTGGMLFLHDILVIDEPRENAAGTFTGSARLQAGCHPLRLYYRHAGSAKPLLELSSKAGSL